MDPVQTTHIKIASACARYSIGKTLLYRLLRDGHIRAVKLGARTLVDVASMDRYFATLPEVLPRKAAR
jgi:excisionase family DNA binding protein